MSRTAFDAGREDEFADMWAAGEPLSVLGPHFGVSPATVSALAKARGFASRQPGRKAQPEEPDSLGGGRWVAVGGVQRWVTS